MFFNFPGLNGKYLYYQEYFILVLLLKGLISSVFLFLLSKCFFRIQHRNHTPKIIKRSQRSSKASDNNLGERLIEMQPKSGDEPREEPNPQPVEEIKSSNVYGVLGICCLMLASISLSWGFTAITAFRYLPILYSIVFNLLLYASTMVYVVRCHHNKKPFWAMLTDFMKEQKVAFWFLVAVVVIGSLVYPVLSYGACVCFYEDGFETFQILDWYPFNTKLTRYESVPQSCVDPFQPCFVYPTLPPDASNSVFINVHTHIIQNKPLNLTVWSLDRKPQIYHSKVFQFDDLDSHSNRNLHTFVLNDLMPNTLYSMQMNISGWITEVYHYQTLPDKLADGQEEFIMVNGGDIGNSKMAVEIWHALAIVKPHLIVIGGDVSYDNNLIDCVWTMDYLLRHYQDMTKQVGRLVPLILAIGNHDIGLNAGAGRKVTLYDGKAKPIIFSFFPQHYEEGRVDRQVPEVSNRLSYFYHTFAGIILFTLDTEYVASMEIQAKWMELVLQSHPTKLKMAHYHNPIFWGCFGLREDAIVFQNGLLYWTPLFAKYRFVTNFENHAHEQKRSKVCQTQHSQFLNGSAPTPNGTLYLGDGSWGATVVPCQGPDVPDYVDNTQPVGSVWVTTVAFGQFIILMCNSILKHQALSNLTYITDRVMQYAAPYL